MSSSVAKKGPHLFWLIKAVIGELICRKKRSSFVPSLSVNV